MHTPRIRLPKFAARFLGDSPAGTYRLGPVELDGIIAEEAGNFRDVIGFQRPWLL